MKQIIRVEKKFNKGIQIKKYSSWNIQSKLILAYLKIKTKRDYYP